MNNMTRRITRNLVKVKDIKKLGTQVSQVNDLVNDLGNDSYIRREKDYHCLTDNIKTILSDNQNLLTVANDNKNNKATLSPKHDSQKEQALQGVGELIKITNGKNASTEKTQVEVLSDDSKMNVADMKDYAKKTDLPTFVSSDNTVQIDKNNNEYDLRVTNTSGYFTNIITSSGNHSLTNEIADGDYYFKIVTNNADFLSDTEIIFFVAVNTSEGYVGNVLPPMNLSSVGISKVTSYVLQDLGILTEYGSFLDESLFPSYTNLDTGNTYKPTSFILKYKNGDNFVYEFFELLQTVG